MLQDQYISIAASPSTAGGDSRRLAVLLGELDKAVKVLNLSAGPVSMSIVRATKNVSNQTIRIRLPRVSRGPGVL